MNRKHVAAAAAAGAAVVVVLVLFLGGSGSGSGNDRASGSSSDRASGSSSDRASGSSSDRANAGPPEFWQLIASTRQAAGNDTGRQSELLEQRLEGLPARSIVDFQQAHHRLDQQIYTWDIWAAAYVIEDGCSEDCFRDFRSYLISLGPGPYEAARRDPDSLASVVQDAEQGDWENADSVAGDAYESVAGEEIPGDDSDLSGSPRGRPWDDENEDGLVQRYPLLAARFR